MIIAQIIIYLNFFIIGVVLGSFFTLATYRIPLKQDITHTRSYCPKCNHKLKFWDLIPILSYIFLKGKCRYCNQKIGTRYILIESFSGLFYLLFVVSLKIDFLNVQLFKVAELIFGTLMISTFFMIGGIAKETKKMSKEVLTFGLIVEAIYITYLYILKINIYRYIIYFVAILLLIIIKQLMKNSKKIQILDIMIIAIFGIIATNEAVFLVSVIATFVMLQIGKTLKKDYNFIYNFSFLSIIFLIIYKFLINYFYLI